MEAEEKKWYDLAESVNKGIEDCFSKRELDPYGLCEFVRSASGALIRHERFVNPYNGRPAEIPLEQLYALMKYAMEYEGTIAMIPLQMSLYKGGQLSLKEFIDHLRDSALIAAGFEIEVRGERPVDDAYERLEDRFNDFLDKAEDHAQNEEYLEAIANLGEAFVLAEKEPLLFYDRCTMYNNRAYYNFRLGRFEEALKDCDTAIEDTEEGLFYHTKAEILLAIKKYNDALSAINKAIELDASSDKEEFRKEIIQAMSS